MPYGEPLDQRLDRVERILYDLGLHEPWCGVRRAEKAQQETSMQINPPVTCTCWLRGPQP